MFKSFKVNDDKQHIEKFINESLENTALRFYGFINSHYDNDKFTSANFYIENTLNGDMYELSIRSKLVTVWDKAEGLSLVKVSKDRVYEIVVCDEWTPIDYDSRVILFESLLSAEPHYNDEISEAAK